MSVIWADARCPQLQRVADPTARKRLYSLENSTKNLEIGLDCIGRADILKPVIDPPESWSRTHFSRTSLAPFAISNPVVISCVSPPFLVLTSIAQSPSSLKYRTGRAISGGLIGSPLRYGRLRYLSIEHLDVSFPLFKEAKLSRTRS